MNETAENTGMSELVIRTEGEPLVVRAKQVADLIVDDETLRIAKTLHDRLKEFHKKAEEYLAPKKKKAYDSYKEISGMVDEHLKPFDTAIRLLKQKMGDYEYKIRMAEVEEQKKKQAELEALKKANPAVAAMLPSTPPPMAKRESGVTPVTLWSAEVEDKMLLIQAVAGGAAPLEALEINQPFLNSMAKARKVVGPLYAGVKAVSRNTSR